jgi:hypothetical protein
MRNLQCPNWQRTRDSEASGRDSNRLQGSHVLTSGSLVGDGPTRRGNENRDVTLIGEGGMRLRKAAPLIFRLGSENGTR